MILLLSLSLLAYAENPVRKVVNLLINLGHEVEAEGAKQKELFDKFMCYCKTNKASSDEEIEVAIARIASLKSTVKELTGSNSQLSSEIDELSKELREDQSSVEQATKVRNAEEKDYQQEAMDAKASIASLDQAIPALQKGLEASPAMLQQLRPTFVRYQSLLAASPVLNTMQEQYSASGLSLLSSGSSVGTMSSQEILGILQQMRDSFKENLVKATQEEEEAVATFENLMRGKTEEIKAATVEIEEKKERRASQMQLKADALEDLEDTTSSLDTSQTFLRGLNKSCDEKAKEFEDGERARAQEKIAIQETIKILNDDSSLEAFKKALPSPPQEGEATFFLQTHAHGRQKQHAGVVGGKDSKHDPPGGAVEDGLSFLVESEQTKRTVMRKDKFWKLKKMVNKMISDIHSAQEADEKKLKWCKGELSVTEGELATTKDHIVHHKQSFESGQQEKGEVEEAVAELMKEAQKIDAAIAEATEQRKASAATYLQTLTELQIAGQLLQKARDRLAQQYQPALVQTASEDADTASMLGLAFLQLESSRGDRGAAGSGILSMIDELRHDIELEETALKVAEKGEKKSFEETMSEAKDSRESKKSDIVNKKATLGRIQEQISAARSRLKETTEEKMAIDGKLLSLHKSCDFLIENFDQRKKARASELDGLQKSLSILSGADFDVATTTPEPPEQLESANAFLEIRPHHMQE